MQQLDFRFRVRRIRGDTDAGGEVNVQPFGFQPRCFADHPMQPPRDHIRIFFRCLRQHNHELIATVAEREINPAASVLHHLPDFGKQFRPNQMAMRVVNALEVVEIDEHQGEFVPVTLRTVNFRFEDEVHVPRIIETGAVVGDGQLVDALDVPRIFKGDRSKIRQSLEQRQVALLKAF